MPVTVIFPANGKGWLYIKTHNMYRYPGVGTEIGAVLLFTLSIVFMLVCNFCIINLHVGYSVDIQYTNNTIYALEKNSVKATQGVINAVSVSPLIYVMHAGVILWSMYSSICY